jgi:hypothetical protein
MPTIQTFNFDVDVLAALLWQYNQAPTLQSLLEQKKAWYEENQTAFWTSWYDNVFNLDTADQFGLSVWAIILDIPIIVVTQPPTNVVGFGWGPLHKNFTHGNFRAVNGAQELTVEQSRTVLKMRYFQITTRGTVPEINQFMARLFGDLGPAYVVDNLDMTMTYMFGFHIHSGLNFIFKNYDILPRPAGVSVDYEVITT